jgi:predicted Rdx family selenoprotein
VYTPGTTRDLIVRVSGKVVYQKKTSGGMNDKNAVEMIRQMTVAAKN